MICALETQQRAIEIFSHTIATQRIWLDRINGDETELKVWEVFDPEIMLELLEINTRHEENHLQANRIKFLLKISKRTMA
jgi:hypothetical protein